MNSTFNTTPHNNKAKPDINSICTICENLLKYFAVNGYKLKYKNQIVNSLHQQTQNGLNVITIPVSFFKYDKQLWVWILKTSSDILEIHLKPVLEKLLGKRLSNYKINVMKNK